MPDLIKSVLMIHRICSKWSNSSGYLDLCVLETIQNQVLVLLLVLLFWQTASYPSMYLYLCIPHHSGVTFSACTRRPYKKQMQGIHESTTVYSVRDLHFRWWKVIVPFIKTGKFFSQNLMPGKIILSLCLFFFPFSYWYVLILWTLNFVVWLSLFALRVK